MGKHDSVTEILDHMFTGVCPPERCDEDIILAWRARGRDRTWNRNYPWDDVGMGRCEYMHRLALLKENGQYVYKPEMKNERHDLPKQRQ